MQTLWPKDKIKDYLNHQLSAADRKAFEHDLACDPLFREKVDEARNEHWRQKTGAPSLSENHLPVQKLGTLPMLVVIFALIMAGLHVGQSHPTEMATPYQAGPMTAVNMIESKRDTHRVYLDQGILSNAKGHPADSWTIHTPGGTLYMEGAFDIKVASNGLTWIYVKKGQARVMTSLQTVFLPAGAMVTAHPVRGVGVPVFKGTAPGIAKLAYIPYQDLEPQPEVLEAIKLTTLADTLTLWHLLSAKAPTLRGEALSRLKELTGLPKGANQTLIKSQNEKALNALKESLIPLWKSSHRH